MPTPTTPEHDPEATLLFVVNAASGREDADAKRGAIEAALQQAGAAGTLCFARPDELAGVARAAAGRAAATHTAVVAVGGDGTINTVAQAAYDAGCAMGVVPQGTFNYFARTHGLPADTGEAVHALAHARPQPVQVGVVNGRVFLVNASLGLYPQLLEDREAYKARFGRSRLVALGAAIVTLMGEHLRLRLHVELGGSVREVRTQTLFVGNNRLQLEQVGLPQSRAIEQGRIAAVMLRPMGSLAMLGLLLRGAFGTLGEAETVDSFEFQRMVVRPWRVYGRPHVKVAIDGEIHWMQAPLEFGVAPRPLYLLKSGPTSA